MLFSKFRITFLFLLFFVSGFTAYAQIEFFHGTWDEAVALAHKKHKVIFVDAFTDWCGPCKMMSAQTFTNPDVGKFFNDNFINVKLDMEKGEGPSFARTYNVNAFPTLLFISSADKQVIHSVLGFRPAEKFLEEGKAAATKGGGAVSTSGDEKKSETKGSNHKQLEKDKKKMEKMEMKKKKADEKALKGKNKNAKKEKKGAVG